MCTIRSLKSNTYTGNLYFWILPGREIYFLGLMVEWISYTSIFPEPAILGKERKALG